MYGRVFGKLGFLRMTMAAYCMYAGVSFFFSAFLGFYMHAAGFGMGVVVVGREASCELGM
jgi:hypothetical protein